MSTALVHRPTENAALRSVPHNVRTPPAVVLADLLIEARHAGDRYGAHILDCMLDRALGLTAGEAL
ncbi:hypothetical protein G6W61_28005 [Streptomyces sp. KAI-26]|uniref:hypothetical protein n=1 Tax=Streptomyces sp. KAI-26 TaxID=1169747 RepID=UPI0015872B39|nr:hypothetical protein [Streptomyces sp. KAI-26]NUV90008.1 hypothetical protein [Streptomyces sp. KAI-26]NUW24022.1 hypothetical protein [Streptomyces roseoviolaceus]